MKESNGPTTSCGTTRADARGTGLAAALVESPDLTAPRGVRDRAMLELLYATGMRASECLGLTLDDVNLSAGYVVCTGKGRKQRLVPVGQPPQFADELAVRFKFRAWRFRRKTG